MLITLSLCEVWSYCMFWHHRETPVTIGIFTKLRLVCSLSCNWVTSENLQRVSLSYVYQFPSFESQSFKCIGHTVVGIAAQSCINRVSSVIVSEWWWSFVFTFPVASSLSPLCQSWTPLLLCLPFTPRLCVAAYIPIPHSCVWPGWVGMKVFVFKPKQFTDWWRGVGLNGCDNPGFLPQQHSKHM